MMVQSGWLMGLAWWKTAPPYVCSIYDRIKVVSMSSLAPATDIVVLHQW